ncbi:LuxR C-terminal-related transcriptional regulator [Solimonas marina]|uniref:Helix-turn-helix transcriptional regulator n=1 Tax=Solimonas marina TaxID=2714601 RepID=A0A969WDX7_9GAMM|nr:LuxR C-terminal-related transcriptional regulator [Solimonas marina]NKF24213.1 helix-turn-helix transcriptional regulator [Solimonas marina]
MQDIRDSDARHLLTTLSKREIQTFDLVVRGLTTKQISFELGVSPRTTENRRRRIYEKLNVRNVAGVVRCAAQAGWFKR